MCCILYQHITVTTLEQRYLSPFMQWDAAHGESAHTLGNDNCVFTYPVRWLAAAFASSSKYRCDTSACLSLGTISQRPYQNTHCCLVAAVCWDYAQSLEELLVEVQVPGSTAEQDVAVHISQQHLLVTVQQLPVIDAPLAGQVLPQCSSWQLGEYLASINQHI
jgi:hypothetical protein